MWPNPKRLSSTLNLSTCSNFDHPGPRSASRQTLDIYLVDPDQNGRDTLARALRERGHQVNVFDDGESALAAWALRTPDVAVIETDLPDMSGPELSQRMHAISHRPIVALSTQHDRAVVQEVIEAGVANYLVKPVSAIQLISPIEVAIAGHVASGGQDLRRSYPKPGQTETESEMETDASHVDALLDKFAFGVIVLNDDRRVVLRNNAAEHLPYPVDVVSFVGGRLVTANPTQADQLNAFVDKLVSPEWATDRPHAITLKNAEDDYHIQIWGSRLDNTPEDDEQGGTPCVALLVSTPDCDIPVPAHLLKSLYDLTPAEALMSKALVNGLSVGEFSTQQKVSNNTARTHLKSIFEKVRVTRQVDLIRTLSKLIPAVRHPD